MNDRSHRRTVLLFAVLGIYIVAQLVWWGMLLLRKDAEVADLALEVEALGGTPSVRMSPYRGLRMVLGEGSVFLLFLLVVFLLTFRAIRRDLALARHQHNFLLAVTHELRSPIAAVKLQLQTLERPSLAPEQRAALQAQALTEVDRLALLTDKVLLAARASEATPRLELQEVAVMALMRDVLERARTQLAPDHRLELQGPDDFTVQSDPEALRSIADNLIENAAKYAPQGTTIRLDVERGREGWRLSVSDEGPGVPASEHDLIFRQFYRSGSEETRSAKGTGLGLYIVQRLAQGLGGAVQVRDRVPHGAIFAASFPNR